MGPAGGNRFVVLYNTYHIYVPFWLHWGLSVAAHVAACARESCCGGRGAIRYSSARVPTVVVFSLWWDSLFCLYVFSPTRLELSKSHIIGESFLAIKL